MKLTPKFIVGTLASGLMLSASPSVFAMGDVTEKLYSIITLILQKQNMQIHSQQQKHSTERLQP